jgi:hypothetical protein
VGGAVVPLHGYPDLRLPAEFRFGKPLVVLRRQGGEDIAEVRGSRHHVQVDVVAVFENRHVAREIDGQFVDKQVIFSKTKG